jgi:WD40 repeat protein
LASGGQIFKLCKLPGDNTVASVAWSQTGTHLSVGSDGGGVQIYDVNQNRM